MKDWLKKLYDGATSREVALVVAGVVLIVFMLIT